MKTVAEVRRELADVVKGEAECDGDDKLIYQGWVEALQWVLGNGGRGYEERVR